MMDLLANSSIESGVLVVILGLFFWLLFQVISDSRRREKAAAEREQTLLEYNQKFSQALTEITTVVKEQGQNLSLLSRELSSLTNMVDGLRQQFDNMKSDVKTEVAQIWNKMIAINR